MNAYTDRAFMGRVTEDDLIEAEQDVLAAIIVENELLGETGLEADDFLEGPHQSIYAGAQRLREGHQRANAVSLKPYLPKDLGQNLDASTYLVKLQVRGSHPDTRRKFDGATQTIKGMSLARNVGREAAYMAALASEGHSLLTLGDEIDNIQLRLREYTSRFTETKALTSPGDAYLASFSAASKRDGVVGVPIALPEIVSVLSEPVLEAGNLYGMMSSSGEGKSSLTMQLITHAVIEHHPVLFLSYDQSPAQCVRQMIAQEHGIDVQQQRDPMRLMTQKEQERCVQFATWVNRQPLQIIRCQREGVSQLVAYARRFIKRYANGKTPFVVLDHIGKVKPRDPKLTPDRISGEVTVELKALMDEMKAVGLVLNQRNGEGGKRENPRPIAKDLYGGEGARADYDAIFTLYRPEKYKKERESIASKPSDYEAINRIFGLNVEGIAEIGAIKVRFGDPSIRERLIFEAQYTRYISQKPQHSAELDL